MLSLIGILIMSNENDHFFAIVGARLREERERFGLSQTEFAKLAGHSRSGQAGYERGDNMPGGLYLSILSKHGIDILYVLTGRRTPDIGDVSTDELEFIKLYRAAPPAVKAAALAALAAGSAAASSVIVSGGSDQRIAGRDYHEHKG